MAIELHVQALPVERHSHVLPPVDRQMFLDVIAAAADIEEAKIGVVVGQGKAAHAFTNQCGLSPGIAGRLDPCFDAERSRDVQRLVGGAVNVVVGAVKADCKTTRLDPGGTDKLGLVTISSAVTGHVATSLIKQLFGQWSGLGRARRGEQSNPNCRAAKPKSHDVPLVWL